MHFCKKGSPAPVHELHVASHWCPIAAIYVLPIVPLQRKLFHDQLSLPQASLNTKYFFHIFKKGNQLFLLSKGEPNVSD